MSRFVDGTRSPMPPSTRTTNRLGRSFPLNISRLFRIRRHPVTVIRTVIVVAFFALPAYLLLINAHVNDVDVVDELVLPRQPGKSPVHLHIREANSESGLPGAQAEEMKQGVRGREALQVETNQLTHDQEKKEEHIPALPKTKWKLYGGVNASYVGCYPDSVHPQQRTLKGAFTTDPRKMTVEMCLAYCTKRNFLYAGLQYYSECYCGSSLEREKDSNDSLCNLPCSGNKSQICGGAPYLSVYQLKNDPGRKPILSGGQQQKPQPGLGEGPVKGFADGFRTCAERPGDDSYFVKSSEESDSMTVKYCLTVCEQQLMPLAGLFRGTKCHCGYLTHNYTLRRTVDSSECQVPCAGDGNVFCGGETHYAIYQTGAEDTRCTAISMGKEKRFPLIALASFPGSGNTWVRYLIERSTGIYTGSYYDDGDLYRKGFKGERENWRKGNTIAVKSHRFDQEHISSFDGAILIVRNPYKAIISEHNRKFGGHTGFASEKHYTQGTEWIDFVSGKSRTWTNTAVNFLAYSKRVLVIHYEDLRRDPFVSLQKMVQFLGLPMDEERILCTLSSPDGKFKRKESTRQKLSFDPYTEEMREVLGLYIKAVHMALRIKNQTALPDEYNPHFDL